MEDGQTGYYDRLALELVPPVAPGRQGWASLAFAGVSNVKSVARTSTQ